MSPLNAIAPCSWTPEKSQVESCEHQDNANIHCQPFPESVSEEHEIYTHYDGCHRHRVKHDSYMSAHFSKIVSRWGNPNFRIAPEVGWSTQYKGISQYQSVETSSKPTSGELQRNSLQREARYTTK